MPSRVWCAVAILCPSLRTRRAPAPIGPYVALTHDVTCRPCMLRECPIDHRCLRDLLPDQVFDAVMRVQRVPDERPPLEDNEIVGARPGRRAR